MNKRSKAMLHAWDPTGQGVIWCHLSIGTASLLKEDNEGVVPVGQMPNNADLIFTQALYIKL